MKKSIKFAVVGTIGVLSGSVAASQLQSSADGQFVEKVCAVAPSLCSATINGGNGDGMEPKKPKPNT